MPFFFNPDCFSHPINVEAGADVIEIESQEEFLNVIKELKLSRVLFLLSPDSKGFDEYVFFEAALEREKKKQPVEWIFTDDDNSFLLCKTQKCIAALNCEPENKKLANVIKDLNCSETIYDEGEATKLILENSPITTIYITSFKNTVGLQKKYELILPHYIWDEDWIPLKNNFYYRANHKNDLETVKSTHREYTLHLSKRCKYASEKIAEAKTIAEVIPYMYTLALNSHKEESKHSVETFDVRSDEESEDEESEEESD